MEKAQGGSAELREECLRTKAAARPDAEARRKAIHAQRFLRSHTDPDVMRGEVCELAGFGPVAVSAVRTCSTLRTRSWPQW